MGVFSWQQLRSDRYLLTCWSARLLLVMTSALVPGSSVAHADPSDDVEPKVRNYMMSAAPAICQTLDAYPNAVGVAGVMEGIVEASGFTDYQAGQVVALSVVSECPRHIELIDRIAAIYHPKAV